MKLKRPKGSSLSSSVGAASSSSLEPPPANIGGVAKLASVGELPENFLESSSPFEDAAASSTSSRQQQQPAEHQLPELTPRPISDIMQIQAQQANYTMPRNTAPNTSISARISSLSAAISAADTSSASLINTTTSLPNIVNSFQTSILSETAQQQPLQNLTQLFPMIPLGSTTSTVGSANGGYYLKFESLPVSSGSVGTLLSPLALSVPSSATTGSNEFIQLQPMVNAGAPTAMYAIQQNGSGVPTVFKIEVPNSAVGGVLPPLLAQVASSGCGVGVQEASASSGGDGGVKSSSSLMVINASNLNAQQYCSSEFVADTGTAAGALSTTSKRRMRGPPKKSHSFIDESKLENPVASSSGTAMHYYPASNGGKSGVSDLTNALHTQSSLNGCAPSDFDAGASISIQEIRHFVATEFGEGGLLMSSLMTPPPADVSEAVLDPALDPNPADIISGDGRSMTSNLPVRKRPIKPEPDEMGVVLRLSSQNNDSSAAEDDQDGESGEESQTYGDGALLDTKELCSQIAYELKAHSIPQAIFAERILGRSQGTLSDLLRNPKPWGKLKSGRETFRRMYAWLNLPLPQRLAALEFMKTESVVDNTINSGNISDEQSSLASPTRTQRHIKKPRLVFTDIQKRTLQAIFKETQRPSKEMQITIAEHLGLDLTTVQNFFMNSRRRCRDRYEDKQRSSLAPTKVASAPANLSSPPPLPSQSPSQTHVTSDRLVSPGQQRRDSSSGFSGNACVVRGTADKSKRPLEASQMSHMLPEVACLGRSPATTDATADATLANTCLNFKSRRSLAVAGRVGLQHQASVSSANSVAVNSEKFLATSTPTKLLSHSSGPSGPGYTRVAVNAPGLLDGSRAAASLGGLGSHRTMSESEMDFSISEIVDAVIATCCGSGGLTVIKPTMNAAVVCTDYSTPAAFPYLQSDGSGSGPCNNSSGGYILCHPNELMDLKPDPDQTDIAGSLSASISSLPSLVLSGGVGELMAQNQQQQPCAFDAVTSAATVVTVVTSSAASDVGDSTILQQLTANASLDNVNAVFDSFFGAVSQNQTMLSLAQVSCFEDQLMTTSAPLDSCAIDGTEHLVSPHTGGMCTSSLDYVDSFLNQCNSEKPAVESSQNDSEFRQKQLHTASAISNKDN